MSVLDKKKGGFFLLHFLLQRGRPKEVKLKNRVNTDFSLFVWITDILSRLQCSVL